MGCYWITNSEGTDSFTNPIDLVAFDPSPWEDSFVEICNLLCDNNDLYIAVQVSISNNSSNIIIIL